MRILIATDVFPPVCGGSGWSTYELARGLRGRGHAVTLVRPRTGGPGSRTDDGYDGFQPLAFPAWAPPVPYLRNYFKNERLYRRMARYLAALIRDRRIDVVHAQHRLTGPPGIAAAREAGVPAICTVRDYWPVCYWSDLIHDPRAGELCPSCTAGMMTRCVRPRAGALWPLTLPLIPYMRANLRRKQRALANADAVVAVGSAIARDLRERAHGLRDTALTTIPNPVDVQAIQAEAERQPPPLDRSYLLHVGKLDVNKGVSQLLPAVRAAGLREPLVVVGDGPERSRLEADARASRLDVRFMGWQPHERVLAWMRHALLLVFTSHWREPLSRVLLEASAVGCPVAAMDTGGTADIVVDGETGLLAADGDELAGHVARLGADAALRARLSEAARGRAESTFDTSVVVARIEALYERLRVRSGAGMRENGA
ncbi:MAG: glycosyltransferase family 4 protein [Acidobacteria bacterium]|nr:glycosyltransferase family 4 protein [Acidobacteriota bacterium]MYH30050.1 glycosyltransferase family 4 protein [Acidobacteriota bacterium]MYK88661.1 glycosyltransferase family 4 protein [Acidobacteriota bacterium]